MSKRKSDPYQCLLCSEISHARGLCAKHYQQFYRTRKTKSATWERQQIKAGKILKPHASKGGEFGG